MKRIIASEKTFTCLKNSNIFNANYFFVSLSFNFICIYYICCSMFCMIFTLFTYIQKKNKSHFWQGILLFYSQERISSYLYELDFIPWWHRSQWRILKTLGPYWLFLTTANLIHIMNCLYISHIIQDLYDSSTDWLQYVLCNKLLLPRAYLLFRPKHNS